LHEHQVLAVSERVNLNCLILHVADSGICAETCPAASLSHESHHAIELGSRVETEEQIQIGFRRGPFQHDALLTVFQVAAEVGCHFLLVLRRPESAAVVFEPMFPQRHSVDLVQLYVRERHVTFLSALAFLVQGRSDLAAKRVGFLVELDLDAFKGIVSHCVAHENSDIAEYQLGGNRLLRLLNGVRLALAGRNRVSQTADGAFGLIA
jgi:hypothetical protein